MTDLIVLSEAECLDLLGSTPVGRVGFTTPQGPRIVPVNFVLRGSAVVFRTAAYTELATYVRDADIAFEADHLDIEHERGWSVVAYGRCEAVTNPEELRRMTDGWGPQTWVSGPRPLVLRLPWSEITGRRVGGPRWPHPVRPT